MHHVSIRRATRLLLLLTAAGACASGRSRASRGADDARLSSDSVVVRVLNRSERTLTIALARDREERRLGEVAATAEARFGLPAAAVANGRVTLVATASHESMRTVPFRARGGQIVWFDIVPGLVGSRVVVRWPEEGRPR